MEIANTAQQREWQLHDSHTASVVVAVRVHHVTVVGQSSLICRVTDIWNTVWLKVFLFIIMQYSLLQRIFIGETYIIWESNHMKIIRKLGYGFLVFSLFKIVHLWKFKEVISNNNSDMW